MSPFGQQIAEVSHRLTVPTRRPVRDGTGGRDFLGRSVREVGRRIEKDAAKLTIFIEVAFDFIDGAEITG
jgi:hypothetical protein